MVSIFLIIWDFQQENHKIINFFNVKVFKDFIDSLLLVLIYTLIKSALISLILKLLTI